MPLLFPSFGLLLLFVPSYLGSALVHLKGDLYPVLLMNLAAEAYPAVFHLSAL